MTDAARARRERVVAVAEDYGGVVSRRLLRELGVDRNQLAREIAAGRWRRHGGQTVAVHTAGLGDVALCWRAIWEVGAGAAALDGASALCRRQAFVGSTRAWCRSACRVPSTTPACPGGAVITPGVVSEARNGARWTPFPGV